MVITIADCPDSDTSAINSLIDDFVELIELGQIPEKHYINYDHLCSQKNVDEIIGDVEKQTFIRKRLSQFDLKIELSKLANNSLVSISSCGERAHTVSLWVNNGYQFLDSNYMHMKPRTWTNQVSSPEKIKNEIWARVFKHFKKADEPSPWFLICSTKRNKSSPFAAINKMGFFNTRTLETATSSPSIKEAANLVKPNLL